MRGRPFKKGKSGNPGGRPKVIAELRALARAHAPDAIKELARLAIKTQSKPKARRLVLRQYANCWIGGMANLRKRNWQKTKLI